MEYVIAIRETLKYYYTDIISAAKIAMITNSLEFNQPAINKTMWPKDITMYLISILSFNIEFKMKRTLGQMLSKNQNEGQR